MERQYFQSQKDPVDNVISTYYDFRSDSKSGSVDYIIDDLTIPSPNFPPTGVATRYIIELDIAIDISDAFGGSPTRPLTLRNETRSQDLTLIAQGASFTNNTFKAFDISSERRNCIEVEIGGVNQVGDTLSIKGFFTQSMIEFAGLNDFEADTVNVTDVSGIGLQVDSVDDSTNLVTGSGVFSGGIGVAKRINSGGGYNAKFRDDSPAEVADVAIHFKIVEIGGWNMQAGALTAVAHGIADFTKIRSVSVQIRKDDGVLYHSIFNSSARAGTFGGIIISLNQINIYRNEYFDDPNYSDTGFNRGWVFIIYED